MSGLTRVMLLMVSCVHRSYMIPDGKVSAKEWKDAINEAVRQCRDDLSRFERDNALVRRIVGAAGYRHPGWRDGPPCRAPACA